MKEKSAAEIIYLAPILASLLFGIGCTFLILTSDIQIYNVTLFSEGLAGSVGNAFYFVISVGAGASILYVLLKLKHIKMIHLITGFVLAIAIFMLSMIYLFAAFSRFDIPNMEGSF